MRRFVLCLLCLMPAAGWAQDVEVGEDEKGGDKPGVWGGAKNVPDALTLAIRWLKKKQGKDGSWGAATVAYGEEKKNQRRSLHFRIGPTAFALYALVLHGEPKRDPVIRKGLKWLRAEARKARDQTDDERHYAYTTYESAAVILLLTALNPDRKKRGPTKNPLRPPRGSRFAKDDWKWMHERVVALTTGKQTGKGRIRGMQALRGGWSYGPGAIGDLSATHFVLVALRAASLSGHPVAQRSFDRTADAVRKLQVESGGFHYAEGNSESAGMTAAGLVSLLVCQDLGRDRDWMPGAITKARKRLDEVFDVRMNVAGENYWSYHYHHLWVVEQVGSMTGVEKIGGHDWYELGSRYLLSQQYSDGSWTDPTCTEPKDVLGTCFALLFLRKATPPLAPDR